MAMAAATEGITQGVVTTGSIASTVRLDYDRGTAHKTYEPPFWVQALYRLAFQAPFPYESNPAALEAARQRRRIIGLLTRFWFGSDLVSPVLGIHSETDGRRSFVTKLVRGAAPKDKKQARRFLRALTSRFLEAGLPTWQVTPHNFRATGNLIEQEDGSYRIIDLESNLVAPLMPVSGIVGAIRQGRFPAFDDIDVSRLDAYLAEHAGEIADALGERESVALREAIAAYARAAHEWHRKEKRVLSRMLRFSLGLVDVPSWVRAVRRLAESGQRKADVFVRRGIDEWVEEAHLSDGEAARLRRALRTPDVAAVMTHLGAHMAMSVPLRFPLGSVARAGWTLSMRAKAEWAALRGRQPAGSARQVHTLLVALVSLIPGFGAGAYLLAKPLRSNRALVIIASDRLLRKLPLCVYSRFHLSALTTWFGRSAAEATQKQRRLSLVDVVNGARARVADLTQHTGFVTSVFVVNGGVMVAGAILYFVYDSPVVFLERGAMNSLGAAQLLLAGVLGVMAFATFWRGAARQASAGESAGIFFWGFTGLGLLAFAANDYFSLHQRVGDWVADSVDVLPLFTSNLDDVIVLTFGVAGFALLYSFRHELLARRHSSTLLIAGVAAAVVMVATDGYATARLQPIEIPAQVLAVGSLLLAYAMRFREVQAAARVTA
jgi:hypothetical protein